MADLIDYVQWRGDLSLINSAFNEVDALILAQLSYLDYSNLISNEFSKKITIKELSQKFVTDKDYKKRANAGFFINPKTADLLKACGNSERFGTMKVCGFINKIDHENEEQFSAVTVLLPCKEDVVFVAFRGTDDTIVGWKEDFNMSFMDVIPSQHDSVVYLNSVFEKNALQLSSYKNIYIAGHSKGGNLAMFSSLFADSKIKKRIKRIYTFDAPGLNQKWVLSPEFEQIKPLMQAFYPQFSIIGMLFNHPERYTVVISEQEGIMQHDPFSWNVGATSFVCQDDFEYFGKYVQEKINKWFLGLPIEERETFVETMFNVLQATEARTNTELSKNWVKNSAAVIKALAKLNSNTRSQALKIISLLFKTAADDMPDIKKMFNKQKT